MRKVGIVLTSILLLTSMTGCAVGYGSAPQEDESAYTETTETPNTDPREGWVVVQEREGNEPSEGQILKRCDGTTLLYTYSAYTTEGFTSVADSPECQPDPQ